jgi:hypothetical protein
MRLIDCLLWECAPFGCKIASAASRFQAFLNCFYHSKIRAFSPSFHAPCLSKREMQAGEIIRATILYKEKALQSRSAFL